jgi:hypothetical protein
MRYTNRSDEKLSFVARPGKRHVLARNGKKQKLAFDITL